MLALVVQLIVSRLAAVPGSQTVIDWRHAVQHIYGKYLMADEYAAPTPVHQKKGPGLFRPSLLNVFAHPALWVFAGVYVIAAGTLILTGNGMTMGIQAGISFLILLLILATGALTRSSRAIPNAGEAGNQEAKHTPQGWRIWAQLSALAVVVLFTLYAGMVFNNDAPRLPGVYQLVKAIYHVTTLVVNPLMYVVVPLLILFALGAHWRELGFARGRRAWAALGVWAIVPLLIIGVALGMESLSPLRLLLLLIGNTLQNGPMEEFLWRGAILTRLRLLMGEPWSIVVSSLAFGLWHIGANLSSFNGDLVPALAFCIVSQATIGIGFAFLFTRTRNLLASSVAHVLFDAASAALG